MSQTMSQSNMSQNTEDIYDDMPELEEIKEMKKQCEEEDKKTCLQLQKMFHMAMLMGFLPNLNTRTNMMNFLNTRGDPDWDYTYIWSLADSNKIDWIKFYDDPQPYEEYKKEMNNRLAEILRPENVIC